MKIFLWTITLLILGISNSNAKPQPSFDCNKAATEVEKLICSDEELSKLDVDFCSDKEPNSLLIKYVHERDLSGIKKSIQDGANVKCINDNGLPIIYDVVAIGDEHITKYFVDSGAKLTFNNDSILSYLPMDKDNTDIINYLVKKGANINVENNIYNKLSPLYKFLFYSNDNTDSRNLIAFLENGADLNYNAYYGIGIATALTNDCSEKKIEYLKILNRYGFDLNSRLSDIYGVFGENPTLLMKVIDLSKYDDNCLVIFDYLIDNGVYVNSINYSDIEKSLQKSSIVKTPILYALDINVQSSNIKPKNILHIVRSLKNAGADMSYINNKNKDALYFINTNKKFFNEVEYNEIKRLLVEN